jgi:putative membrane protein
VGLGVGLILAALAACAPTAVTPLGPGGPRDAGVDAAEAAAEAGPIDEVPDAASPPDVAGTLELDVGLGEAAAAEAGQAQALTKAEIAGVVLEFDLGQVRAGQLALGRASGAAVGTFAARMVLEHASSHERFARRAEELSARAIDSDARRNVAAESSARAQTLALLRGPAFDVAYLDAVIKMKGDAVVLYDELLIPPVEAGAFRAELVMARATAARHLAEARALK